VPRFALTAAFGAVLTVALVGCGSSALPAKHQTTPAAAAVVQTVTVASSQTTAATGTTATTATTATTGAPAAAGGTAVANFAAGLGVANLTRPFAADSPWNTPVTNATLAVNSTNLMHQATIRYGVVTTNNSLASNLSTLVTRQRPIHKPLFINTTIWTDPIIPSAGGPSVTLVCRQVNLPPPRNDCGDGWSLPSLPIETSAFPKPQYDGWLTVFNQATGFAYDFWRARYNAGNSTLTYQFVRRWDLNGPGFLPPNYVGARGSGLPLFAGEILPRELISGHINHALAISVPGPASRFYVQPASATDGNGAFQSLPEGARIRLNPSFNIAAAVGRLPGGTNLTAARAVMQALKTYGAVVVDRSAVPTLYALPNFNWTEPLRNRNGTLLSPDGRRPLPAAFQNARRYGTPLLSGDITQGIFLENFQVVALPRELQYPPLPNQSSTGGVGGIAPQSVLGSGTTAGTQASATGTQGSTNSGVALP
jgi:hypothetical protein